ncbi:MAG: hypothetical protein ACK4M3_01940 [Pyrobaculum sp.]
MEDILFQGANRSGFLFAGGPIYVMASEHGVGRYLTRVIDYMPHGRPEIRTPPESLWTTPRCI